VPEDHLGSAGAQHAAVIDAVGANSIASINESTLRPGRQAPGPPPSLTAASTSASIPSRRPRVTASTIPASTTTRSSSNTTSDRSGRSCTTRVAS
jgi:hypothetical protein